jgi:hypothetical protein
MRMKRKSEHFIAKILKSKVSQILINIFWARSG